jgi:hypothetical protein
MADDRRPDVVPAANQANRALFDRSDSGIDITQEGLQIVPISRWKRQPRRRWTR